MVLLNVLVFAVSGVLGLMFLVQTLNRLTLSSLPSLPESAPPGESSEEPASAAPYAAELMEEPGALEAIQGQLLARHVKLVFSCWIVVFGLVGSQMGWVLRPFIGDPHRPFQWFRERESNFFEAVWFTLVDLLT
jgi:hypothetical protein